QCGATCLDLRVCPVWSLRMDSNLCKMRVTPLSCLASIATGIFGVVADDDAARFSASSVRTPLRAIAAQERAACRPSRDGTHGKQGVRAVSMEFPISKGMQ